MAIASIGEIKDHGLTAEHIQKYFALKVLSMYLPNGKIIFDCIDELSLSLKILGLIFVHASLREIEGHSLRMKNFQKPN